ncbi:response regulator [Humisphaera borealis]|uniref:Response regulator n=1 Tax=Humisphaera borealis TaxID=2807512 RepID=A0A7M2X1C6_9BACT|nr:response regulator [Humisphaera borealis]QOV91503.1 response regulator [Humisphaera borealis]
MRILLVEDHEDTSRAMATLLRFAGHEVVVAATGAEAERAFDACGKDGVPPFDCAVVDLGLPDTTGTELMRSLLRRGRIPGVALTGSTAPEDIAACLEAGFTLHVAKPVLFEDLEAAIARCAPSAGA